jgi:hypothetical protein
MEKLISCCGLNCTTCEARIATVKNDDELRRATAEKWGKLFNVPDMAHASICEIRKCADLKGFITCGECSEMEICNIVAPIHENDPETILNLRGLN